MADADCKSNVALRVRKLLAAASNYEPGEIHGGDNLGDPPPLGIPTGALKGMIPALSDIIHDYKADNDVDFNDDVAKLTKVSQLIGMMWKKCGLA